MGEPDRQRQQCYARFLLDETDRETDEELLGDEGVAAIGDAQFLARLRRLSADRAPVDGADHGRFRIDL